MNSYQILNELQDLYTALNNDDNGFLNYIKYLIESKKSIQHYHRALVNTPSNDRLNIYSTKLQESIDFIKSKKGEIKIKKVFEGIQKLEEALDAYENGLDNTKYISFLNLSNKLEEFGEKYQDFLDEYSRNSFVELVEIAESIDIIISTISNLITAIISNLESEYPDEKSEVLSLFLNSDYTYQEFVQKLNSIQEIYSILCKLLQISENEVPLRIIKVESGSVWVRLFGEPTVIKLFEDLIRDTVKFIYRNYTKEGKIQSLPSEIEVLDKYLNLKEKLEEKGCDTTQLTGIIDEASLTLTQKFYSLLSGEEQLRVNGELLEIAEKDKTKHLKGKQIPLLEGNNEPLEE